MGHNMDHHRNETFSNIQRMLKAQQESLMRIHSAPSMPFMRTMSPMSQTHSCEKCGYVSKWKSNLTRHMRLKHGEIKEEHNVGYPYNQVLYPQNMYSTSAMSNFAVGQSPTRQQHLSGLLSSAGNEADDKPNQNYQMESPRSESEEEMSSKYGYQVPDCEETFSKTQHHQIHKIKPYKCENCSETFESQLDWKKHSSACEPNTGSHNISAGATNSDNEDDDDHAVINQGDTQHVSPNSSGVQNNMEAFEAAQTETETNERETLNGSSS